MWGGQQVEVSSSTHTFSESPSNEVQDSVDAFVIPALGDPYIHKLKGLLPEEGHDVQAPFAPVSSTPRTISVQPPGAYGRVATFAVWPVSVDQEEPLNRWVYSLIGSPIYHGKLIVAGVDPNFDLTSVGNEDLPAIRRAVQRCVILQHVWPSRMI